MLCLNSVDVSLMHKVWLHSKIFSIDEWNIHIYLFTPTDQRMWQQQNCTDNAMESMVEKKTAFRTVNVRNLKNEQFNINGIQQSDTKTIPKKNTRKCERGGGRSVHLVIFLQRCELHRVSQWHIYRSHTIRLERRMTSVTYTPKINGANVNIIYW